MEEEFQHLSIKEEAKLVIESDDNILDYIDYNLYLVGLSLAKSLGDVMSMCIDYNTIQRKNSLNNFMRIRVRLDDRNCYSESHCRKLLEAIDGVVVHGWLEEIRPEYRRQIKNPVVPWHRERGKKMLWDNVAKSSGVESSNDNAKI
ncbi:hypothetical protein Goshw_026444 [Gossypium schwendimanii]|uniref:Uncharacterized protein n=1 Tax=Gossypium schwendimanii TaxID=34291 RepID=A0A7J9LIG4_GOSSC|nr:hypothetical protein [Gossypium schwendimanii]